MNDVVRVKPAGAQLRRVLLFSAFAALTGVLAGSVASRERAPTARAKAEPTLEAPVAATDLDGVAGTADSETGKKTEGPAGLASMRPAIPTLAPAFEGFGTVTVFLVLLLGASLLLLKRGARPGPKNGQVRVVDTVPLGGRRLIHLVRCGDRRYLIGNSERGIHFLASVESISDSDAVPAAVESRPDREGEESFDDVFQTLGVTAR